MAQIIVQGAPRKERGKNEARRLRQGGNVPAVLYGGEGEALTLAVNAKQVTAILRSSKSGLRAAATMQRLREMCKERNIGTLRADGLVKVKAGITTYEEILRATAL